MSLLPPSETPLNQHSLEALELWLKEIGATRNNNDPCLWNWEMSKWTAEIKMEREILRVTWRKNGERTQCSFPYGLSREDVQIAIYEGP